MRHFRDILAAGVLLSLTLYPLPAHASVKKVGGIALVVVGGLLVGGGVILYAVRYNAEELGSAAPAIVVGGLGVASIVTGAVVLSSGKPEQRKNSLQLAPMYHESRLTGSPAGEYANRLADLRLAARMPRELLLKGGSAPCVQGLLTR